MRRRWFSILCIMSGTLFAAILLLCGRSFQETEGLYRLINDGSGNIRMKEILVSKGNIESKYESWVNAIVLRT